MLSVMFCMFEQLSLCFAFKESPFTLCGSSLKALFSSFASTTHFCMYHGFCWCSNFMPTHIQNCSCQIFMALCKINCNVLKCYQTWSNPKYKFFLQYDVLFRTPSLPFRAYLVHFVRFIFNFSIKLVSL